MSELALDSTDPSRLPSGSTWPLEMKAGGWCFPADPSSDRSTMRRRLPSRFGLTRAAIPALAIVAAFAALAPAVSPGPKFYKDDPIKAEPETQDASRVVPWSI